MRRCASRALAAGLEPVIVVLGHEAERTREELGGLQVRIVVNPEPQRGINSSLRAGIEAVTPESGSAVVLLAPTCRSSPRP